MTENITGSATENVSEELSDTGEISLPTSADTKGGSTPDLSQDLTDILSSFSSQRSSGAEKNKESRKASRFRVSWHADIIEEQNTHHGSINDISIQGTSIYLNSNLPTIKCKLHIHVPPLSLASKSHIIVVSGRIIYAVYDSNQQRYRAGVNFLCFNLESDLKYLEERLIKHHSKIPEF